VSRGYARTLPESDWQRIEAMARDGASRRSISLAMGVSQTWLRTHALIRGVQIGLVYDHKSRAATDAGKAVLARMYETEPDIQVVFRAYCEATGRKSSLNAMRTIAQEMRLERRHKFPRKIGHHIVDQWAKLEADAAKIQRRVADTGATYAEAARTLGVSRSRATLMRKRGLLPQVRPPARGTPRRRAGHTVAELVEMRRQRAANVQALMDAGCNAKEAAERLGYSRQSVNKMLADKLVIRNIPWRPIPPRRVKSHAPPKPRAPKPTYETVEAWLAAGNAITRCPTAAAHYTTAEIPEADRAALTAIYAARENAPKDKRRWNSL
jgi:transposase